MPDIRMYFKRLLPALLVPIIVSGALAAEPLERDLPDYGMMFNEDGDVVMAHCLDKDPLVVAQKLHKNLDSLLNTPVQTLIFNVACGSDVMHYPTRIASRWGWRHVKKEESEPWATYMPAMRAASAAGMDSVRIAAEWAKDNDILFVPSYRINDSHYTLEPDSNPLTGRFYADNSQLELGKSPVPGDTSFARLLDFEREEVRAYRLGVMLEVIERYADVMDGFQIDFMRQPILFQEGHAQDGSAYLTQMIREVRKALDVAEQQRGRSIGLIVRVPPSLANCAWSGISLEQWIEEGLVDVVIPSAGMTLTHDVPYEAFRAPESPSGVRLGIAVFPRTQFAWPMVREPSVASYSGVVGRNVSPAQLKGAVNNAAVTGATLVEFYNVNLPLDEYGRSLVMAAGAPMAGDRVYAVTPAYYLDHTDTFEYRKQVPLILSVGESADIRLNIGEEVSTAGVKEMQLRLGLRGIGDTNRRLKVGLNGSVVFDGPPDGGNLVRVSGRRSRPSSLHPDDPQGYLHIPITDYSVLNPGMNRLTLMMAAEDVRGLLEVVEVQLACFSE